ncbi:MAG: M56 family metallopeptidase, partial [Clostridia bacterium]|nr:M56 family metallopeptidase [Clostridia bacterium]
MTIYSCFIFLLNIGVNAGWVILALIALRFIFRKAPKRILCDLWGIAALRLILPVSVQNPFSLIPSARFLQPDRVGAPYLFDTGIEAVNESVYSALDSVDQIGYVSANDQIWLWLYRISFTWFVGVCVLLILAAVSYFRVRRSVRESAPVRDRVYLCDGVGSPFILGLFRPKIYIPAGTDEFALKYIEAHETAHIRRLDHIRKPIAFLLLCVYWFQPLVWLAYYLFCRDVEGACDEYAIGKYSDTQRAEYAETLLRFSAPMKSLYSCPVAFGETGVKARIRFVVKFKEPARALIAVILIAACIFGFAFLSDPVSAEPGPAKKYVLFNKTDGAVLSELTAYETIRRATLRVYGPDGTKTVRGSFSPDANESNYTLTDAGTGDVYVFGSWIRSYSFLAEQSTGNALGAVPDENE